MISSFFEQYSISPRRDSILSNEVFSFQCHHTGAIHAEEYPTAFWLEQLKHPLVSICGVSTLQVVALHSIGHRSSPNTDEHPMSLGVTLGSRSDDTSPDANERTLSRRKTPVLSRGSLLLVSNRRGTFCFCFRRSAEIGLHLVSAFGQRNQCARR